MAAQHFSPMAFRQHNKNPETAWRKKHRDELLQHGMPDFLIDDERRWNYVLLHGADDFQSGWNPSRLTKEQASNLLAMLRQQYSNPTGLDLLRELEKRTSSE
jgi:hypothetical protein